MRAQLKYLNRLERSEMKSGKNNPTPVPSLFP